MFLVGEQMKVDLPRHFCLTLLLRLASEVNSKEIGLDLPPFGFLNLLFVYFLFFCYFFGYEVDETVTKR